VVAAVAGCFVPVVELEPEEEEAASDFEQDLLMNVFTDVSKMF
jgi:hypothetical protein